MSQLATDEDDLSPYIDDAVKQAKKRLHRTQNIDDPTEHRAHVCFVCVVSGRWVDSFDFFWEFAYCEPLAMANFGGFVLDLLPALNAERQ